MDAIMSSHQWQVFVAPILVKIAQTHLKMKNREAAKEAVEKALGMEERSVVVLFTTTWA